MEEITYTKLTKEHKEKVEKMLNWKKVKAEPKWEKSLKDLLNKGLPSRINVGGLCL